MKPLRIITEDFFIGNLGDHKITDEIVEACNNADNFNPDKLLEAEVGSSVDHKIRNCKISWMSVDKVNFIEHGLRKIVENVNTMLWKINLDHEWQANLQYTKYSGKGHFYDWHRDTYPEEFYDQKTAPVRRISIVYSLSHKSDFVGGEFQIEHKNSIYTRKFNYGDFIVFPSNIKHRVKPLKTGVRTTLVGWYK